MCCVRVLGWVVLRETSFLVCFQGMDHSRKSFVLVASCGTDNLCHREKQVRLFVILEWYKTGRWREGVDR